MANLSMVQELSKKGDGVHIETTKFRNKGKLLLAGVISVKADPINGSAMG
jgi:hypothetical protein